MKQKDITIIVVVVVISAIASLLLSNLLISSPKNRQDKVEIVPPISAGFVQPDVKYFNTDSIDPTKVIQIGEDNNPKPFKPTN